MSGITSRILDVPYHPQPTPTSCQGTVLKMFATYLAHRLAMSVPAAAMTPEQIKTLVNTSRDRPDKNRTNSHENFRWFLESQFPSLRADKLSTPVASEATEWIVRRIDMGYPVLCSVTHANNRTGHIILAVGYDRFRPGMSSMDFTLIAHDPYGAYDPSLSSTLYGKKRWEGGQSLMGGGESGPGRNIRLSITAASRQHKGAHSHGQWLLSSVSSWGGR